MSNKLWAGRFSQQTHPDVDAFNASIHFDALLAYDDILGSLAHVNMLQYCSIITGAEHQKIYQGLQRIAAKIADNSIQFSMSDEDIHMNIERLLIETIGEVARKLHTARSRNDQVALDTHLYLRKQILTIMNLLVQLQQVLFELAQQHSDTLLPGYTHLQRAQPIYLAQHWHAYIAMLQRDITRLQDSWPRINQSPLGAAALAGTTLAIDKHYTAQQLGFETAYINSLDAVSDRDFVVEFLANSALIMMHISRLSEELILWSSQEFNFISFHETFTTGSSIMPQKKNPDVAELARGKTGRVYGALLTVLTVLKGLPLAYNKDLQEDKEPLFDTVKTLQQTLAILSPLLATMTINTENMQKALNDGYLNATALAEYLVKLGLSFRTAHELVGKMVAYCLHKSCRLEDLSLEELQQFTPLLTQDSYAILMMDNIVAACMKDQQSIALSLQQQIITNHSWITDKITMLTSVYEKFGLNYF